MSRIRECCNSSGISVSSNGAGRLTGTERLLLRQPRVRGIHGHSADTRDRQTYHHHHRGHQGNNILVPTSVHGSSKEKCDFLPEHHHYRIKRSCSHLGLLNFKIHAYRPRAGRHENNNNDEHIYIARIKYPQMGSWHSNKISIQSLHETAQFETPFKDDHNRWYGVISLVQHIIKMSLCCEVIYFVISARHYIFMMIFSRYYCDIMR